MSLVLRRTAVLELVAAVAVVAIAGCGGQEQSGQSDRAATSPPDATATANELKTVLAVGGWCWARAGVGTCASSPPNFTRSDLPDLSIRSGDEVSFAFGFEPTEVVVELQGTDDSRLLVSELVADTSTRWTVPAQASEAAFVVVRTKATPGDVAYVAQVNAG